MISQKQNNKISKFLSLVLRHAPETINLTLDQQGWARTDELISKIQASGLEIDSQVLEHVVETNAKKRFAFNEDKTAIRANQGHSISIDHGFKAQKPPHVLYHGTSEQALPSILKKGIEKRSRHHVHLSAEKETAFIVGQRHGIPVVLQLDAQRMHEDGHTFFLSQNGVWLTDYVHPKYIISEIT